MRFTTRRSVRYAPDEGVVAWIDKEVREDWHDFVPLLAALVVNEANAGCGLVVLSKQWLEKGMQCMVLVGDSAPLKADVRWLKDLGEGVARVGLEYMD